MEKETKIAIVCIVLGVLGIGVAYVFWIVPPPRPPIPDGAFVITDPLDGAEVTWRYVVKGNSDEEVILKQYPKSDIYVLIYPVGADAWWVQPPVSSSKGKWEVNCYFGRYEKDVGVQYKVCAIVTEKKLIEGQIYTELPDHVAQSNIVSVVIRK